MEGTWNGARSAAVKILGIKARLPEPKNAMTLLANLERTFQGFSKCRDALEDKVAEMQNAGASFAKVMKQYGAVVDKADFGLNAKDKDDAKKIEAAKKVLQGYVDGVLEMSTHNDKALTELDKHLMLMSRYQSP